jgi:hypothetical protein
MQTSTRSSILDQFTPHILGMFWFTKEELGRDLLGFDDLNYLFDGLISQYIYGNEKTIDSHVHIFFTENFRQKIFISHVKTEGLTKSQISGEIDEHIALISAAHKNVEETRKKILVFDQSGLEWTLELKKRYSQFEFLELIS